MMKVSPDIANIAPYVPGKPVSELERELGLTGSIKMASNENPLGASKKALQAIHDELGEMQRYPDGSGYALKQALSNLWDIPAAQVILGNGSNEIIELLSRTFILPGDEVIMAKPSFSLYRLMIQSAHGRPVQVPLKNGRHDLVLIEKAVTSKTRLIFICNPNNPTGTIVHQSEVRSFLSSLPKEILVIFDEAYAEYVGDSNFPESVQLLKEGASLIMLRTFSKIYGLAGLRIGYGIGHPDVIDYMNRVRQPFNTSSPAQQGALAALSDEAHLKQSQKINRTGKTYLMREFDVLGLSYFPSEANFIYFNCNAEDDSVGEKIQKALLKKGVIIRHLGGPFLRVTIGLPGENRRFIKALKEVIEDLSVK